MRYSAQNHWIEIHTTLGIGSTGILYTINFCYVY